MLELTSALRGQCALSQHDRAWGILIEVSLLLLDILRKRPIRFWQRRVGRQATPQLPKTQRITPARTPLPIRHD